MGVGNDESVTKRQCLSTRPHKQNTSKSDALESMVFSTKSSSNGSVNKKIETNGGHLGGTNESPCVFQSKKGKKTKHPKTGRYKKTGWRPVFFREERLQQNTIVSVRPSNGPRGPTHGGDVSFNANIVRLCALISPSFLPLSLFKRTMHSGTCLQHPITHRLTPPLPSLRLMCLLGRGRDGP